MINQLISQAIKASKLLLIEYINFENQKTKYWIAIRDIDIDNKSFFVDAFNVAKIDDKSDGIIQIEKLYFDNILSAFMIDNTSYEQPQGLIEKIIKNIDRLEWLSYDLYNDNTLDYIYEAMKQEEVAYQTETTLIRNIDQEKLESINAYKKYYLTLEQISDLVPKLERLSKQEEKRKCGQVTLALNLLSISTNKGLFVVAYKELTFNPIEKSLILSPNVTFNYEFSSLEFKDFKHNLKNYLDIETDEFTEIFINNPNVAKDKLMLEAKRFNESIDDRPYIIDLKRSYYIHIEKEIEQIKSSKKNNELSIPMQAFFGNMSKDKIKRTKHVDVIVLDDKANIDQLRVIYNALIQPITYVQGPPGTGKTQTIINILISALFNNQTVLVSSNNNKPITDIYKKLLDLKSKNTYIPLPFLRLGNQEEVLKTLNYCKVITEKYSNFKDDDKKLEKHFINKKDKMKEVNSIIENYELKLELEEEVDALKSMKKSITNNFRNEIIITDLINRKSKKLKEIPYIDENDIKLLIKKVDESFISWLFFTSIKYLRKLQEPKNAQFLKIINSDDNDTKVKEFNKLIEKEENIKKLLCIFPIILTTNQSAYKLGPQGNNFDLCIIDEAGQCAIGPSLFPLTRCKRLLLVGDQNQLKPVISISSETNKVLMNKFKISPSYDYLNNSILLTMQKLDTISKFVLLRYHYRSRKDIINFSNIKYYNNQLKMPIEDKITTPALEFINVDTSKTTKQSEKNISTEEINAIINSIKSSENKNIGIITPFRNQAYLLKEILKENNLENIDIGTVHTFQGDEKDIIYFSSGITNQTFDKTYDWIKNNQELINVATTRAKKKFVLVTDYNEIEKRSKINNDFFELAKYVKNNGKEVILTASNNITFINGYNFKSFNSKKEMEFLETINHLLTLGDKYISRNKVRVASILDKFTSPTKYDYGLKAEFDLVIFKRINNLEIPVVAIEFDGEEHINDQSVIRRDKLKEQIAKDNGLKIIRISNDYSRRYIHIKEILLDLII